MRVVLRGGGCLEVGVGVSENFCSGVFYLTTYELSIMVCGVERMTMQCVGVCRGGGGGGGGGWTGVVLYMASCICDVHTPHPTHHTCTYL